MKGRDRRGSQLEKLDHDHDIQSKKRRINGGNESDLCRWIVKLRNEWCPVKSYSAQTRSTRCIALYGVASMATEFSKWGDEFTRVICLTDNEETTLPMNHSVECVNKGIMDWIEQEYDSHAMGSIVVLNALFSETDASGGEITLNGASANSPLLSFVSSRQESNSSQSVHIPLRLFVEYILSRGIVDGVGHQGSNPVPMVVLKLPSSYDLQALKHIPTRHTNVNRAIRADITFVSLIGYLPKLNGEANVDSPPVTTETLGESRKTDQYGTATVQSLRQFHEAWHDEDLKQRLLTTLGGSLYGFHALVRQLKNRLEHLMTQDIDDQAIYDDLHTFAHENLFRDEEYLRKYIAPESRSRTSDSRIKDIHNMLDPMLKPSHHMENRYKKRTNHCWYARRSPRDFKITSYVDVGCSEGSITAGLGESFGLASNSIHGCDVRDVADKKGFTFSLIDEKTNKLPYKSDTISLVSCLMVLHHVDNPEHSLKEIWRILEPGGLLVLREHDCNRRKLSVFLDLMHGLYSLVWSLPRETPDFCRNYTAHYRSKSEWNGMAQDVGFECIADDGNIFSKYIYSKKNDSWWFVNAPRFYISVYRKPIQE